MTDLANVTLEVLKNIRDDLRGLRADVRATNERLDQLTVRVDTGFAEVSQRVDVRNGSVDELTEHVHTGFAEAHRRLDGTLASGHHTELESRVRRIEDHLGLSNG